MEKLTPVDFEAWKETWRESPNSEVDAHDTVISWQNGQPPRPFVSLQIEEAALDRSLPFNPPVAGAADSSDAGANLQELRELPVFESTVD